MHLQFDQRCNKKHTMVGQKYFKEEANVSLGGEQKYTKYNKININPENFRGAFIPLVAFLSLLTSSQT